MAGRRRDMAMAFLRDAVARVRTKYHNRPVQVDGIWFQSQREAARWCELVLLRRAGQVLSLRRQMRYPLTARTPDGRQVSIGVYVADFVYTAVGDPHKGEQPTIVVEDAKGVRTDLYRWKKRHFELQYGLTIREV